jgi:hypothetical protein
MRTPLTVVAVLALLALTTRPALAAPDELIPCKLLSVKVGNTDTVKFRCKAPKAGAFALPQGTSDPTYAYGGGLLIRDLGSNLFIIPGNSLTPGYWTGLGNPAGSGGFRYKNTAYDAPCRVVTVTTKRISGTCRASFGPSSLPAVGDVGLTLTFVGNPTDQKRYCAQFGGTPVRNDVAALLRKNAPAPGSCPPDP